MDEIIWIDQIKKKKKGFTGDVIEPIKDEVNDRADNNSSDRCSDRKDIKKHLQHL